MIEALIPILIKGVEFAVPIIGMAFSEAQKRWLKERDRNTCQLRGFKGIACDNKHLEADHVIPQRFAKVVLGMPDEEVDSALNGLILCRNHHRGHPDSKHPDAHKAWYEYQGHTDGFIEMFAERDAKLERGEVYWNQDYDEAESAIALRNTRRFTRNFTVNDFPEHNYRNGK